MINPWVWDNGPGVPIKAIKMEKREKILGFDFQGWPVCAMTLRQILVSLGAEEKDGTIGFKSDDKILDVYPKTLEDDGMGYGVNGKFISEASADRKDNYINIFIEKQDDKLVETLTSGTYGEIPFVKEGDDVFMLPIEARKS